MAETVAAAGAQLALMHMQGEPRTMQNNPRYEDVVDDVKAFLAARLAEAVGAGIDEQRIVLDPGIGFGKALEHNLQLLNRLDERASGADRDEPQIVHRHFDRARGSGRPPRRHDRHQRDRLHARRDDLPCP